MTSAMPQGLPSLLVANLQQAISWKAKINPPDSFFGGGGIFGLPCRRLLVRGGGVHRLLRQSFLQGPQETQNNCYHELGFDSRYDTSEPAASPLAFWTLLSRFRLLEQFFSGYNLPYRRPAQRWASPVAIARLRLYKSRGTSQSPTLTCDTLLWLCLSGLDPALSWACHQQCSCWPIWDISLPETNGSDPLHSDDALVPAA